MRRLRRWRTRRNPFTEGIGTEDEINQEVLDALAEGIFNWAYAEAALAQEMPYNARSHEDVALVMPAARKVAEAVQRQVGMSLYEMYRAILDEPGTSEDYSSFQPASMGYALAEIALGERRPEQLTLYEEDLPNQIYDDLAPPHVDVAFELDPVGRVSVTRMRVGGMAVNPCGTRRRWRR